MIGRNSPVTQEEFVARARSKHGDRYDYSSTQYVSSGCPVAIVCSIHGEFQQHPFDHLDGHGCHKCYHLSRKTWTEEQDAFIKEHYVSKGCRHCADFLGKTKSAVWSRASKLDVQRKDVFQPRYQDIPNSRWTNTLRHAVAKGRRVDIDREFVWDMYLKQDKKCALTGWDILFHPTPQKTTASIDRIDSKGGYTKDNVQLVHKLVNRAKVNYDEADFYDLCKAVHEHRTQDFEREEVVWVDDPLNDTQHPVIRRTLGRPDPKPDCLVESLFGEG